MADNWNLFIYDRDGVRLAQAVPGSFKCSWLLNDVGQAQFTLATSDPACRADILRYGNFVLMTHETLPAWGGVIWTPREWGPGAVTVNCFESAFQLRRIVAPAFLRLSGSPGSLFRRAIQYANSLDYDTRLRIGYIYDSGSPLEFEVGDRTLLDAVRAIQETSREAWRFVPNVDDNNELVFQANWYKRFGPPSPVITLQEGINISLDSTTITETGDIYNNVICFGQGSTPDSKARGQYSDEESIGNFGLSMLIFEGDSESPLTVAEQAFAMLELKGYPRLTFSVTALPETFGKLNTGNVVDVRLSSVGFFDANTLGVQRTTRIIGMEWDANANTCRLALDDAIIRGETTQDD